MRSLREIYETHNGRLLNKWEHYIDIYEQYFHKYRNKDFVFLEIGIAHGGSLQMWREYFGELATIIGVDVNPECKQFEEKNTRIFIGSQEDPQFLTSLRNQIPSVDVLLDDGGHTMKQQIVTFNEMFAHVKANGLYVCEDIHTSYWKDYGGGLNRKKTFIEFSKKFIDNIHAWHAQKQDKSKIFNNITESVFALHYYDSILFIEKRPVFEPYTTVKGEIMLSNHFLDFGQKKKWSKKIRSWIK
jgi:cephalosporin hydroxylase